MRTTMVRVAILASALSLFASPMPRTTQRSVFASNGSPFTNTLQLSLPGKVMPLGITQATPPKRPRGVYAKVSISDYLNADPNNIIQPSGDHAAFNKLYRSLLKNPAISGLTLQVHWDWAQPNGPNHFNLGYVQDAFDMVEEWNNKPHAVQKNIQLIPTAGFNSPKWLLDSLTSCDLLFIPHVRNPSEDLSDCGKATFGSYFEDTDNNNLELPLPWNKHYQKKWKAFLKELNDRFGSRPELVSISIAGPSAGSAEMILPNVDTATSFNGLDVDEMWNLLFRKDFPHNSDQAFIETWKEAINTYEDIFNGLTLVATPGAGIGFPSFWSQKPIIPMPTNNPLYYQDCDYSITNGPNGGHNHNAARSCEAAATILSYFRDTGGSNRNSGAAPNVNLMATQTSGMRAASPDTLGPYGGPDSTSNTGDMGIAGVKLLSLPADSLPPSQQFLGGAQFDHQFSTTNLSLRATVGCPPSWEMLCQYPISPEQAEYNVLKVFFKGTLAASDFFSEPPGPAPMNYLQVFYQDVFYADANLCAEITDPVSHKTFNTTAQDMLVFANQSLLAISDPSLPPLPHRPHQCSLPPPCNPACSEGYQCIGGTCRLVNQQ